MNCGRRLRRRLRPPSSGAAINKSANQLSTSTLLAPIYFVQTPSSELAASGPYGVEFGKKERKPGPATFGGSKFGRLLKASLPPSATPFFCARLGRSVGYLSSTSRWRVAETGRLKALRAPSGPCINFSGGRRSRRAAFTLNPASIFGRARLRRAAFTLRHGSAGASPSQMAPL
jgi:hypothetical protein